MEELVVERGEWEARGACVGGDRWKLFFPPTLDALPGKKRPPQESPKAKSERVAAAKALCKGCPVQTECEELGLSLTAAERHGIWGGLTEDELAPKRGYR